jgi:hypothetical protein
MQELMKKDKDNGGRPTLAGTEKLRQRLLAASIQSMFLKRLSQGQKEYCKLGHEAEMKLIRQVLRDSDLNLTKIRVLHAYSIGLVAKKGESHVKDLVIFLVVVEENGIRKVLGVEMKARVTGATQQASLQHVQQRMIDDSSGTPNLQQHKYVVVDAIHPNLGRYVEKLSEAIQILHHAYTYQMDKILLLVGNQQGDITSGVWVKFGNTLLNSYGEYLRQKYQFSIQWMYNQNAPRPPPRELE